MLAFKLLCSSFEDSRGKLTASMQLVGHQASMGSKIQHPESMPG